MTTKTTENGTAHSHTRSHRTNGSANVTAKANKVADIAKNAIDHAEDEVSDLADRGRGVVEEGETLLTRFEGTLKQNPYMALGIGAGAGLLVGTVFGSRLGRMALLLAGGYVASEMIKRGGIDFESLTSGAGIGASDDDDEGDDEPQERVRLDDGDKSEATS